MRKNNLKNEVRAGGKRLGQVRKVTARKWF